MKINHWQFEGKTKFSIIPVDNDPASVIEVEGAVFLVQMTDEEYKEFAQRMIMNAALTPLKEMFTRVASGVINNLEKTK